MTQFFDALERQLVTLSMQTPRMTPRVRARRRVAVGTITVLCMSACVAGASLLPHLLGESPSARSPLFATLRTGVAPISPVHPLVVSLPGDREVGDLSAVMLSCGRNMPVAQANAVGRPHAADANEGHRQELVCVSRSAARRESNHRRPRCAGVLSLPTQDATDRFIGDETGQGGGLARDDVDPCRHETPPLAGRQP